MSLLKPTLVNAAEFAEYGSVLDKAAAKTFNINDGFATRYDRLAIAEIVEGNAQLAIFSARKRSYPMKIDMMERHPLGTQAFYPLEDSVWYAIVSSAEAPSTENLRSFIVPAGIGLQYNRNIWHYPLLIESKSQDFLIMDYAGKEKNLEIYTDGNLGHFSP